MARPENQKSLTERGRALMKRITEICLGLLMAVLTLTGRGTLQTQGYERMTGLSQAVNALLNKDDIVHTAYTGRPSTETWNASDTYALGNTAVALKEEGRDFVILNLTDIHFSDYGIRAWMAFGTASTVRKLVRSVKPDLITVTGDIFCGESTVYAAGRFTDLMNSLCVPWAPVFGNHDGEANCDRNYLADTMGKSPYCLLRKGDPALGIGNYIVNVAEKNADGGLNVLHSLILMDTQNSHVNSAQIQWYRWAAEGICGAAGKPVESSVLFHIPIAEYQSAYEEARDGNDRCWRAGYDATGRRYETICCDRDEDGNPVNNGFFTAVQAAGTTKTILCGHDHMNNFSVVYRGVRLAYALKAGRASGYQPGFNGGTVLRIDSDGHLTLRHRYVWPAL